MKENRYILTETELHTLLQACNRLEALQEYGVDNWDGYEEAMNDEEFEVTDEDFAKYPRIGITDRLSVNADKSTGVKEE